MPPRLALLLCFGFSGYLIWQELRRSRGSSIALWLPTLWIAYCGSRPLSLWFSGTTAGGGSDDAGSALDRNVLFALIVAGCATLSRRSLNWAAIRNNNKWLLLLFAYAFISILWSGEPFVSLKRYIRLSGVIIMALIVVSERNPSDALESVFKRAVYFLIPLSIVLIKYYPNLGVAYHRYTGEAMWVGVTIHKNSLGTLAMFAVYLLVWCFLRDRGQSSRLFVSLKKFGPDLLVLLLSLFLLSGQGRYYSASAVGALVIGGTALIFVRWLHRRRIFLSSFILTLPIASIFLYGFALPFVGASAMKFFFDALGRDTTLTGRTEIWEILIPEATSNALIGFGYGGFWIGGRDVLGVKEAHSGYMELMLELGIVGIALLFVLFCAFAYQISFSARKGNADWANFAFSFLLIITMYNASNASFLGSSDLLWNTVVFLKLQIPGASWSSWITSPPLIKKDMAYP